MPIWVHNPPQSPALRSWSLLPVPAGDRGVGGQWCAVGQAVHQRDGGGWHDVGMGQPVLTTDRLLLIPLAEHHLELMVGLDADPDVMRYVGGRSTDRARTEAAHRRRLGMASKVDGLGHWMAFERGPDGAKPEANDLFVGLLMLPPAHGPDQPDDPSVADLGYRLMRRAWGRGYGREATRRLLEHAFDTVGMSRVIAQTAAANAASRRLLEAIGLRYVRTFESLDDPAGPPVVEYGLSGEHWKQ
jgi:RimJ/RimL family protein N-acetyltransferase